MEWEGTSGIFHTCGKEIIREERKRRFGYTCNSALYACERGFSSFSGEEIEIDAFIAAAAAAAVMPILDYRVPILLLFTAYIYIAMFTRASRTVLFVLSTFYLLFSCERFFG